MSDLYKWSKVSVVLPEGTRGTIVDAAPDQFNHNHSSQVPLRFDISPETHWVWYWALRHLDVLETMSEI